MYRKDPMSTPNSLFSNPNNPRSAASEEVLCGEVISESSTTNQPPSAGPTSSEGPRYIKSEPLSNNPFSRSFFNPPGASSAYQAASAELGVDTSKLKMKNPVIAAALGLFFGPIGLIYSNLLWAIFLGILVAALLKAHVILWIFVPPIFILCALIGFGSAMRTNWKRIVALVNEIDNSDLTIQKNP
ncbi:hypothetical protein [Dermatophilus congolensis]|uniref:hypothetical protein n=2 Tax=Dermatophilus congolensis TaxID=1863 RepID=UPI001AAEA6B0|nr:hypothetical protein [Dermatophilus congolensis]MBO3207696.1 hypothetical protein [Dermatophilus congolensis]MBO3211212.1 hypothetical protein [Dermatophilus congolensis]